MPTLTKKRTKAGRPSGLSVIADSGSDALDLWFGLSRASFAILPRTLMQEMPDEWQGKMAALLNEYDAAFTEWPTDQWDAVRAQLTKNGKCVRSPEWLVNYRHPNRAAINALRPNIKV